MIPSQLLNTVIEGDTGPGICYFVKCYLTSKGGSVSGIMPMVNSDAIHAAISSRADIRLVVDVLGGGAVGREDVVAGGAGVGPGCPNERAGTGALAGCVDSPPNALVRLDVEAG
jgi:hypothetical protein